MLSNNRRLIVLRIATQSGSCYDIELSPRTDIELQRFNTLSDAIQALRHGNADVLLNDAARASLRPQVKDLIEEPTTRGFRVKLIL